MSDDTRPFRPRDAGLSDSPTGQLRAPAALAVDAAGRTDKGRVRPGNEDAFGLEPPTSAQARAHGTLLIVSDGMGGHAAGEVASNLAVDTIKATYYREHSASTADAIRHAITTANGVIFEDAEQNVARSGMGCTIVVMVVQGSNLTVGHVGDSRGYLVRGGRARPITRDHSWVAMQVEEGILTPEQAEHHPNRSLLMRALGRQPSVEVEIGQHQLQAGDVLILCSDGLTGVVNDAEIGEYASRYAPATAADQLVSLANQRGAPDNVTVVAAAITAGTGAPPAATTITMAAPVADAPTPRLVQPPASAPAAPTPRKPAVSSAPPAGKPIVVSRASTQARPGGPPQERPQGRRGRGRWLTGSIAAFGLAAGLVLMTTLGPRMFGDPDAPRAGETPVASKPAGSSPSGGQAAPAATVPPPVATGIPGLAAPGTSVAAAPPPPAAPPPAATPPSAAASEPGATATSATAGGPAATGLAPSALATPTRPAGSPPALTAPTSVPPATPTPASSGAPGTSRDGVAGPADLNAGAGASTAPADPADSNAGAAPPSDPAAPPSDATGTEANPDAGAPPTTEGTAEGELGAEDPGAAPAPEPPPAPRPRFFPGTNIQIPDSFPPRPGRRAIDD